MPFSISISNSKHSWTLMSYLLPEPLAQDNENMVRRSSAERSIYIFTGCSWCPFHVCMYSEYSTWCLEYCTEKLTGQHASQTVVIAGSSSGEQCCEASLWIGAVKVPCVNSEQEHPAGITTYVLEIWDPNHAHSSVRQRIGKESQCLPSCSLPLLCFYVGSSLALLLSSPEKV